MTVEHLRQEIIPLYTRNHWVQTRYPEEGIPTGLSLTMEDGKPVYRFKSREDDGHGLFHYEVLVVED